jgi:hypothetical protein
MVQPVAHRIGVDIGLAILLGGQDSAIAQCAAEIAQRLVKTGGIYAVGQQNGHILSC